MKCSGVPVNLKPLAQGALGASNAEHIAHGAQTEPEHMPARSIGNEEVESSILSRSTINTPFRARRYGAIRT